MMRIFAAIARFLGAAGLLLGFLVPFAYATPTAYEVEPNDTLADANILTPGNSLPSQGVNGQTSSGSDQDWFKVTATGAGTIQANLRGPASATGQGWTLTIKDSSNNVLALDSCLAGPDPFSCDISLTTGIGLPGTYYIVVSSSGTLTTNDYSLTVTGAPLGVPAGPTCTLTATPSTITAGGSSTLTASCPGAVSYVWTNSNFAITASSGTVSPAATTIYSVTGFSGPNATGNSGNAATATVTVTPSAPNCTLTASPTTITSGQSSTLAVSCVPAATSYTWSTGFASTASGGTVFPTFTTTYTVTGINGAGTGNTAIVTVTVAPPTPPAPPTCTLTASPTTITGGSSSTLTATCFPVADTYSWTNTTFTTSTGTVSPATTTTYSVTGINAAGPGNTASVTVLVTPNCTLTASPITIAGGGSATLTATCSPAATSYAWTGTGFPSTAASGTVSPTDTTTYSVVGNNPSGTGNSANATVSVKPNCTLTASPVTILGGGSSTLTVTCIPAATFYAWTNTNFGPTATSGAVSPAANTTYSVIGSNAAGASTTASVTVLVTPNCTLTASPSTIIGGQSSTLTATCSPAATSYAWTPTTGLVAGPGNTATVTPTSTTTYSVTGSDAAGAGNSASATVSVTPNCTLTASPSAIPGGGSSTLTVTCNPAATSYAWTNTGFGSTATSGTVTPTITTTYSVIGSNAAGAGNSATVTVGVTPTCTLTASPSTVTVGGFTTLTATCNPAATSYAWTNTGFGPTVNIGNVAPTVSTTYSVIGSNAAGAGSSASVTVAVTTCTYSLSPASQFVPLTITSSTVSVTSTLITVIGATSFSQSNASACAWTAISNVSWITMPFSTSGSGNGTVFYSVASNTNGGPRTGTLTIGGQTFTVAQDGMTVPTCTLAASASTISLDASVVLTATCSPAATSYAWAPADGLVAGPGNTATVTPTAVGVYQYSVTGSNAGGPGNTASTLVTVTPATFISRSDCLFNWAERTYPEWFAPAGAISNTLAPYYYRYYLQTNSYLGTSSADSHVYYLGPLSNHSILDVGALSGWLSTAGCQ